MAVTVQPINVGVTPNDGTGEPVGRALWQKINANFVNLDSRFGGVVYQQNLGEIGYPPEINSEGAIEAILSVREVDEDNPPNVVLLPNEIALNKKNGTVTGLRTGDGVTPNGINLPSSSMIRHKYSSVSLPSSKLILEIPEESLPSAPFLMQTNFVFLNISDVDYKVRVERLSAGSEPTWNAFQLVGFLTANTDPALFEYGKWPQASQEYFESVPPGRALVVDGGGFQISENNRSLRFVIEPLDAPSSTLGQIEISLNVISVTTVETPINVYSLDGTPGELFVGGVLGGWIDPYDLTTMRQNSDGTGAVTTSGDPVGWIQTKGSASPITFIQPDTGKRPVWRFIDNEAYLEFDGVDDFLYSAAAVNLSSVDEVTLWAAQEAPDNLDLRQLISFGDLTAEDPGSFCLFAPLGDSLAYLFGVTSDQDAVSSFIGSSSYPDKSSLVGEASVSEEFVRLYRNKTIADVVEEFEFGTGNLGNYILRLGADDAGGSVYKGKLFGAVIAAKTYDLGTKEQFSDWLMQPRSLIQ